MFPFVGGIIAPAEIELEINVLISDVLLLYKVLDLKYLKSALLGSNMKSSFMFLLLITMKWEIAMKRGQVLKYLLKI